MKSVKSLVLKLLRYMVFILGRFVYYAKYMVSLFHIAKVKRRVFKKRKNNKVMNVVFIIQYVPSWNKLEPIYQKMKKDSRFNPSIVCVPMEIENHKLKKLTNETYDYFVNKGYDVINAITGDKEWFDIRQLTPDFVFHSRPYNHFLPKIYTSDIIVKNALICNVMYGMNLTHNVEPILLNEEYFKNCFCYFAHNVSEKKYYVKRFRLGCSLGIQKCEQYGGIGIERILHARAEKKSTNFRKTVLWTPRWSTDEKIGGSNFFRLLDTFKMLISENPSVLFIIRPHPLMFNNFLKTGEMSLAEVDDFKRYCNSVSNVILDENEEYYDMFWQTDCLVSDSSAIVPEYFVTGKPILYCQSSYSDSYTEFYNEIISRCYEVFTPNDLIFYLTKILSGNDLKEEQRLEYINSNMTVYQNNSSKIVEYLCFNKSI